MPIGSKKNCHLSSVTDLSVFATKRRFYEKMQYVKYIYLQAHANADASGSARNSEC